MSDDRLLDIEPGGESTQYESIRIFIETPPKQTGQMGVFSPHTTSEMRTYFDAEEKNKDDDAEWAHELELGESTSNISGETDKDLKEETANTRRLQGYGPGSGVGA